MTEELRTIESSKAGDVTSSDARNKITDDTVPDGIQECVDTAAVEETNSAVYNGEEQGKSDANHTSATGDESLTDSNVPQHPVDRGWAWVILAGCFFELFLHGGTLKSYGVLFVQYQQRFNCTASETALMNTIQNLVISFTGLFVMTIGLQKFTCRTVIVVGGVLMAGSFFVTAFARTLGVYYVIMGIFGGIGTAMTHPPMFAILGTYFNKHRGLANSIFVSGASVGSMVMAPTVTKMFEVYGYTGAMMIIAAIFGNIVVSGLLMRPPESYTRSQKTNGTKQVHGKGDNNTTENILLLNTEDETTNETQQYASSTLELQIRYNNADSILQEPEHQTSVENINNDISKQMQHSSRHMQLQRTYSNEENSIITSNNQESLLLHRVRALSVGNKRPVSPVNSVEMTNISSRRMNAKLDVMCRSHISIFASSNAVAILESTNRANDVHISSGNVENDREPTHVETPSNCCEITSIVAIFNLSLLKNPVFIVFLAIASNLISGMSIAPVYIPPHAKDIGISNERVAMLISLQSIIELVSRLAVAVVVDRKLLKSTTILGSAAFIAGTTYHFIRFIRTFPAFIALYTVIGMCCGLYISMFAVILADVIGLAQYKSSLGFTTLCHGVSIAVFFPISGLLRDSTGSYVASYHLFGSLAYIGSVFVFLLPVVHKWTDKRRGQNRETHSTS